MQSSTKEFKHSCCLRTSENTSENIFSLSLQEKKLFGKQSTVLNRGNGWVKLQVLGDTGFIEMTCYTVFDGIYLIYNQANTQRCHIKTVHSENTFQINHCLKGRFECEYENEYMYLESGDMAVSLTNKINTAFFFPGGYYKGITVLIDCDSAPNCLSCFLEDVNVRPAALMNKFCACSGSFIARSDDYIEHIFSELYLVNQSIRKAYCKIKVLELLLFLSQVETNNYDVKKPHYTKVQVELAKKVSVFISQNLSKRITIQMLAEKFFVSQTQLKEAFKGVYGTSIPTYIRAKKMDEACSELRNTHLTVSEIAMNLGYDNSSKFAAAFKRVIGVTPKEYRKRDN